MKRLRYSFLFLLPAIVLLIFVIFVQSQIIFGQAEDTIGETPKEIITECGENELAALGANGLRCKSVKAVKARTKITTRDLNISNIICPFGIKAFKVADDDSSTLSYECVVPTACGKNQFLSVQAGPTFTCIDYNIPILKNKSCNQNAQISGFDVAGVPICTPVLHPLSGISCPAGQYLTGARTEIGINNGLYMIGFSGFLYELNTEAIGDPARKIGKSFGVETFPTSITSHNGKLYMVGRGSNFLYELNIEATRRESSATRIGESFGDMEDTPTSITSHAGKLYMVGKNSDWLYELDTTGRSPARRIGESFGDQEDDPSSITSHNGKLYMVGDGGFLYELDTTGRNPARRIGTKIKSRFGSGGGLSSITSHNGKLYKVAVGGFLYELNTEATGNENPATLIGVHFYDQEDDPRSVTSHNGKLYMIGFSGFLYELDTEATATEDPATRIGISFSTDESHPVSITSHSIGGNTKAICENFPDGIY